MDVFEIVRGCARKARYREERFAQKIANRRMWEGSPPLRVYGCSVCGGWHLTKNEQARAEAGLEGH